jgi:predicted kinase
MGSPGCGKSTLCVEVLEPAGYVRVNQDMLGSKSKCRKAAEVSLRAGRSVVVDSTNKTVLHRREWSKLAAECGARTRLLAFQPPKEAVFHQNCFRSLTAGQAKREGGARLAQLRRKDKDDKSKVPDMLIHSFFKNAEWPTSMEAEAEAGLEEVLLVRCTPRFRREADERLFFQYLLG